MAGVKKISLQWKYLKTCVCFSKACTQK